MLSCLEKEDFDEDGVRNTESQGPVKQSTVFKAACALKLDWLEHVCGGYLLTIMVTSGPL